MSPTAIYVLVMTTKLTCYEDASIRAHVTHLVQKKKVYTRFLKWGKGKLELCSL